MRRNQDFQNHSLLDSVAFKFLSKFVSCISDEILVHSSQFDIFYYGYGSYLQLIFT